MEGKPRPARQGQSQMFAMRAVALLVLLTLVLIYMAPAASPAGSPEDLEALMESNEEEALRKLNLDTDDGPPSTHERHQAVASTVTPRPKRRRTRRPTTTTTTTTTSKTMTTTTTSKTTTTTSKATTPKRVVTQAPATKAKAQLDSSELLFFQRDSDLLNEEPTVYFQFNEEGNCRWQYNYGCKFFNYITCVLFGRYGDIRILDHSDEQPKDGDIVVIFTRSQEGERKFVQQWRSSQTKITLGAFHIGDEKRHDSIEWYGQYDFVLHNYYRDDLPDNALRVPIGANSPPGCKPEWPSELLTLQQQRLPENGHYCKCGKTLTLASERAHHWNFMGLIHRNRKQLVNEIEGVWGKSPIPTEGILQGFHTFGGKGHQYHTKQDPKVSYFDILSSSMFTFAPCGNVEETHRMYESLTVASIPVIEVCEDDTEMWFSYKPLLHNSVVSMVQFVKDLVDKPDKVNQLQRESYAWWLDYCNRLSEQVLEFVKVRLKPVPQR